MLKATPPVIRPLVAVHPASRIPSLFIPDCHISKIYNLTTGSEIARDTIIPKLMDHITQDVHTYQHQWEVGDLIIWDNRSTLHAPTYFDSVKYKRLMWRLTMHGDEVLPSPSLLEARLAAVLQNVEGRKSLDEVVRARL